MAIRVTPDTPALILAPMEGMTDAPMRALMSEIGGFSWCVGEFLRISQDLQPDRIFLEHIPELRTGSRTPSGLPVQLQLLGGDPELLAQAALKGVRLGSPAIDLNFGCPSRQVNRHDGGASLLKHPERIRTIVETVRKAVPREIPVSAKLRLGWENPTDIHHNADMAAQGGADWITIHGRTKAQGYAPPALWEPIGEVRRRLGIPVVANGDIWTIEDFRRCRDVTGCSHFMLGRGAMANPLLASRIARELDPAHIIRIADDNHPLSRGDWHLVALRFVELCRPFAENSAYIPKRLKQWLRLVHERHGLPAYEKLKLVGDEAAILETLRETPQAPLPAREAAAATS